MEPAATDAVHMTVRADRVQTTAWQLGLCLSLRAERLALRRSRQSRRVRAAVGEPAQGRGVRDSVRLDHMLQRVASEYGPNNLGVRVWR